MARLPFVRSHVRRFQADRQHGRTPDLPSPA